MMGGGGEGVDDVVMEGGRERVKMWYWVGWIDSRGIL